MLSLPAEPIHVRATLTAALQRSGVSRETPTTRMRTTVLKNVSITMEERKDEISPNVGITHYARFSET